MNFHFGYWPSPHPQFQQQQFMSKYNQTMPEQQTECEESVETKETKKRERWSEKRTMCLVKLWNDNLARIESSHCNKTWKKIQQEVDKLGPSKTIKQCELKIRNLKDVYKKAKEQNFKSGESPNFPNFYHLFDEAIGARDAKLPKISEVGFKNEKDQLPMPSNKRNLTKQNENEQSATTLKLKNHKNPRNQEKKTISKNRS